MIKKFLKGVGILFVALLIAFLVLKAIGDARYYSDYDPKLPPDVKIKAEEEIHDTQDVFDVKRDRAFHKVTFDFEARPGDRVPCILTQPANFDGKSKLPTIIFIHGSGQSKNFVQEICTPFNQGGFAMVSYDQWNCGERKIPGDNFSAELKRVAAWYDRGAKAVNDARRMDRALSVQDAGNHRDANGSREGRQLADAICETGTAGQLRDQEGCLRVRHKLDHTLDVWVLNARSLVDGQP